MPTFGRTSDSIVVNPTVDRYTATASQTAFTLTNTPSSQVLVWVNGILQEPTTHYTLSGRTLTLGTACTVGDKVAVEYGTGGSSPIRQSLYKFVSGNPNPTISTSWSSFNSSTWDGSIAAVAGDVIDVAMRFRLSNGTDHMYIDFATVLSGTPTNSWVSEAALQTVSQPGSSGLAIIFGNENGTYEYSHRRACVAGDLVSGVLTCRLIARSNSGSSSPTIYAAVHAVQMRLTNYGQ